MQDPSLHDEQLEDEIRLVGDLVLAASQSEDPLTQEAIDAILGLEGRTGANGAGSNSAGSNGADANGAGANGAATGDSSGSPSGTAG